MSMYLRRIFSSLSVIAAAVMVIMAIVIAAVPSSTVAHGGDVLIGETNGAYSLRLMASSFRDKNGAQVDLTAYPVRQDLGSPDLKAQITFDIETPEGRKEVKPRLVGDGFEALIPGSAGAWRDWKIGVTVEGAAGRSTFNVVPQVVDTGPPALLIPISIVVAVIAVVGSLLLLRRRRRVGRTAQISGL